MKILENLGKILLFTLIAIVVLLGIYQFGGKIIDAMEIKTSYFIIAGFALLIVGAVLFLIKKKSLLISARNKKTRTAILCAWFLLTSLVASIFLVAYFHSVLLGVVFAGVFLLLRRYITPQEIRTPDRGAVFFFGDLIGTIGPGLYPSIRYMCEVKKNDREHVVVEVEDKNLYVLAKKLTEKQKKAGKEGAPIRIGMKAIGTFYLGDSEDDIRKSYSLPFLTKEEAQSFLGKIMLSELINKTGSLTFMQANSQHGEVEKTIQEAIEQKISEKYGWHIGLLELFDTDDDVLSEAEKRERMGLASAKALNAELQYIDRVGNMAQAIVSSVVAIIRSDFFPRLFSSSKKQKGGQP